MKINGFTLIELLVVVAIIGILASVGVVAYSGYTDAAKKGVAKANHKSVTKYVAAELMRCVAGEKKIFEDKASCNSISAQIIAGSASSALKNFKNPFGMVDGKTDAGIKSGGASWEDGELGYTTINTQKNKTYIFETCFQLPCNAKDSKNNFKNLLSNKYSLN
tara:strand:- start:553 stop:1041 length:489 start_codon:yes stop_codon:yes gene_type:complete